MSLGYRLLKASVVPAVVLVSGVTRGTPMGRKKQQDSSFVLMEAEAEAEGNGVRKKRSEKEKEDLKNSSNSSPEAKGIEVGGGASDFQPRYPLVAEEDENDEEKQYWIDKKHCSFCSIFLDSPCRRQFKNWSVCVDRCNSEAEAKAEAETGEGEEKREGKCDFANNCTDDTMALFSCQGENEEYFEPYMKAEEELKKKNAEEDSQDPAANEENTRGVEQVEQELVEVEEVETNGDKKEDENETTTIEQETIPAETMEAKSDAYPNAKYELTAIDVMPTRR